jgi:hypothetical protein
MRINMVKEGKEILKNVKNVVHEKTQVHKTSIDLTVHKVYKIKNRGSLDFGGSEFKKSVLEEIPAEKKSDDDKYGWWKLEQGIYMVEFNEKLIENHAILQSIPRLIQTGSYLPMQIIEENNKIQSILTVGPKGVNIKENARIAALYQLK